MSLESDADAGVRDRTCIGIHHGHREIRLADAVDPFAGRRSPGRVGLESRIPANGPGKRGRIDVGTMVDEGEIRDLDGLRCESEP